MAGYETSEIMAAAALMHSNDELDKASKDISTLRTFLLESKKKIEKNSSDVKIYFGSEQIRKGFLETMITDSMGDDKELTALKDLAVGISVAKGIRNYLVSSGENLPSRSSPAIYMTGDSWPDDVEKFKVSQPGFKDYNSSDIMITTDKKTFYGISLKKKRQVDAPEPTIINKAFDTLLEGKEFDALKKDIAEVRTNYFSGLVREAIEEGLINWRHINNSSGQKFDTKSKFDAWANTESGKKELFESKKRDKNLFGKYSYIDTKGSSQMNSYILGENEKTTNPKSMRYFVNKKLASKDNILWKNLINVMNKYSDLFADKLIDFILKIKLYKNIDAKELTGYNFNFFLVTGVGDVSKTGTVSIGKSTVTPLKTTLCGLTRIENDFSNSKYEIVLNESKKDKSEAAKVFLTLQRGGIKIIDIELRYKGSFTPQPQFFGTLNKQFKDLLINECGQ